MMNEGYADDEGYLNSEIYGEDIQDTQIPETQENEEGYRVDIDNQTRNSNEFTPTPPINMFQNQVSRASQQGRVRRESAINRVAGGSQVSLRNGSRGGRRKQSFQATLADTMAGFREFQRQSLQQTPNGQWSHGSQQWGTPPNAQQWGILQVFSQWGIPPNAQQWGPSSSVPQWGTPPNAQQRNTPPNVPQWSTPPNVQQWGSSGNVPQWGTANTQQWGSSSNANQWDPSSSAQHGVHHQMPTNGFHHQVLNSGFHHQMQINGFLQQMFSVDFH
ncbi:unnamed protein product [Microthlaspi erraticum]|uniref:Uncharacterized protein n=1 Tax=Microthlaspi erraticum TaxID=1685480 RepID=A0A6D2K8N3_9BRAS|nr:unnamed protein product [Microthlaspi erraticum]